MLVFCLARISIISWKARQRRLGVRIWLSKSRSSCWSTSPPRLIQAAGLSPVKAGGTNVSSRSRVISGCRQRQTVPIFPMILSGKPHPTPTPLIRSTEKKKTHTYQTKKTQQQQKQNQNKPTDPRSIFGSRSRFPDSAKLQEALGPTAQLSNPF